MSSFKCILAYILRYIIIIITYDKIRVTLSREITVSGALYNKVKNR